MKSPRSMLFTLILGAVTVSVASFSWAADKPTITITNSISPDGLRDITIVDANSVDVGEAAGTARIRDIKTGRTLGSFDWSGFGEHPDADAFKVLWRPDCKCLAISWEATRGFVRCAVYVESKSGWLEVQSPDFL
jgi:hypothetical protein